MSSQAGRLWMGSLWMAALAACPHAPPAQPTPVSEVYLWRPSEATIAPEALGALMRNFYDPVLLLQVTHAGDSASITVASGAAGQRQDRCALTSTLPPLSLGEGGTFTSSGHAIPLTASALQTTLQQTSFRGSLTSEGLQLDTVEGRLDTRELLALIGTSEQTALCEMTSMIGPCVPCADGEPLCWPIALMDGRAQKIEAAVDARSRDEICADPACASRCL